MTHLFIRMLGGLRDYGERFLGVRVVLRERTQIL